MIHIFQYYRYLEDIHGYKKMRNSLGFADLALASSLKHNRSLELMNKLNDAIDWDRVEQILMAHYTVGTSGEGADAYPPLLLFKCMLLQKWFRINSDPELENQINDRLSFKKFLGLSFDRPSPDHSTFSRFRSRLSKNAMDQINSEIYGLKEHAAVDTNHGFILTTTLSEASVNDTNYLDYCTVFSKHTKTPIKKVYADKGYAGMPNRDFLAENKIADGIMRKDSTTAKFTR